MEKPLNRTDLIKRLSADELLKLCDEIVRWKYIDGELPEDSLFKKLAKESDMTPYSMENEIVGAAVNRFRNAALLLVKERPQDFFRNFK